MNKFVFITDIHMTKNSTDIKSVRTDNYFEAIMGKLDFVVGWCKKNKVNKIILGGDIFNTPSISDYVAGKMATLFRKSGLKYYYIIGNHDIIGKNPDSYLNTKLHLFENYDWFHMLGNNPVEFSDCTLVGIDYSKDYEDQLEYYAPVNCNKDKHKILVIHAMISGEDRDFVIGNKHITISYKSLRTDYDVVLCGHNHVGFDVKVRKCNGKKIFFANPGSFARTDLTTYKFGIGPGFTYVEVQKGKEPIVVNHKIECTDVFKHSDEKVELFATEKSYDEFVKALHSLKKFDMVKSSVEQMIDMMRDKSLKLPFIVDDRLVEVIKSKISEIRAENRR